MSNQPTVGDPTLGGIELDMSNGNGPWGGNNGGSNGSGSGPWGGNAGGSGNRPQRGSGGGSQDNGNTSANVEDFLERVRRNSNGGGGGNRPNRGGGSGGPGGGDVVALLQRWWWLVLLGLVGAWLASGFYTVDASDRAVVTTFGRFPVKVALDCTGVCPARSRNTKPSMCWSRKKQPLVASTTAVSPLC